MYSNRKFYSFGKSIIILINGSLSKNMNRVSGIYRILNVKNGKFYIGSSSNIYTRLKRHKNVLKRDKHENIHLQHAWNKYGEESFIFEVVEECLVEELIKKEQYYLDVLKPYDNEIGYNICVFADSVSGKKHTEQAKQKMREKALGRVCSEEQKQKIREMRLGKKHNEETKKKMSESHKGRSSSMLGKNHKPETIEKMKKAHANKKFTDEELMHLASFHVGEKNSSAKLTEEDVKNILFLYEKNKTTYSKLGKMFNVSKATIFRIIKRKSWKHLGESSNATK